MNGWRKKAPLQLKQSPNNEPLSDSQRSHRSKTFKSRHGSPPCTHPDKPSPLAKPSMHSQTPSKSEARPLPEQSLQAASGSQLSQLEHSGSEHPSSVQSVPSVQTSQPSRHGEHSPPNKNDLSGQTGRLKSKSKSKSQRRPSRLI